jgi:hypothetical protein
LAGFSVVGQPTPRSTEQKVADFYAGASFVGARQAIFIRGPSFAA